MNKFKTYISADACFVLPRTRQCGSGELLENTDFTRLLKAPAVELSHNAFGEQTKQFVLISVLQSAQ